MDVSPLLESPGQLSRPAVAAAANIKPAWEQWVSARTPTPALSVTVLNCNYGRYLNECLASILCQTFTDFEVIVIDDASNDGSLTVAERYLDDPRVRLVAHNQNRGFTASLIEGTEVHSRGRYLAVISADDLAQDPTAFARQVAAMDAHPEAAFCFSGYSRVSGPGDTTLVTHASFAKDCILPGPGVFWLLASTVDIQIKHSGAIIRRSAYVAAGGYRPDLRYVIDTAIFFLLPLFGSVAYVASPLYRYRVHPNQMSSSRSAIRLTAAENLDAISQAFALAAACRIQLPVSRRTALRTYLPAEAVANAFDGRRQDAFLRAWSVIRVAPLVALTSRGLWAAVLRAVLGPSAFRAARHCLRALGSWRHRSQRLVAGD
jgi:glycosyltransferase involved in cell wall biosynthesis